MNEDALSAIISRLSLVTGIFTEADYCGGAWAIDTSGMKMATFHLVQEGDCWLHMDAMTTRRLNPGDLVFFPRDARHLLTSAAEIPADVIVNVPPAEDPDQPHTRMLCGYFEFASQARWPLFEALPEAVVLSMQRTVNDSTRTLIDLMLSESNRQAPGSGAVLQQLSYVLLIYILRKGLQDQQQAGLLAALNDPRIGQVLQLIHARPEQQWRLATLAAQAGMSRASFAARFNELVGQPAMQYLAAWRMQVAIDLLTGSTQSMLAIAEAVGYSSEAAFRNAFTKHVGEPPGHYRRSSRIGKAH